MKLPVEQADCKVFPGGWSYYPQEMFHALQAVEHRGRVKMLEFGAGQGTEVLADLLIAKQVPFLYVSYENDARYLSTREDVHAILWKETPDKLHPEKYDLVLIDGPRGSTTDTRLRWFPLLQQVVRKGTVLVIDDFGHNPKYRVELDRHFTYFTVAEKNPEAPIGESWAVVQIEGVVR
jgi:hypothetical protein